jgi:ureidoacrylate peracid hydrolase
MRNAFASAGGMLDLAGIDVRPAVEVIANARLVCEAARHAHIPVVYLTIGYPPDQTTADGPESPNLQKELALCLIRERPELRGEAAHLWDQGFRHRGWVTAPAVRYRHRQVQVQRIPRH